MMKYLTDYLTSKPFIVSVAIVVLLAVMLRIVRRIYRKGSEIERASKGEMPMMMTYTYDIARTIILTIGILSILQVHGVNVTSLIAGLGIFSAVAGLAMQDFFKDLIMGLHIISDKFFKVGDVVQYAGEEGEVIEFNIRTTKIKSILDGDVMTISNRNISEIKVSSNMNSVDIPLPYEEDYRRIHEILEEVCREAKKEPGMEACVYLGTQEFADSAILYKIRYDCAPSDRYRLRRHILSTAQEILAREGISIPYNQLDVHMQS